MQPENYKIKLNTRKSKLLLWKGLKEIFWNRFWNIFSRMAIPQRHHICKGSKDNKQAETTNRFVRAPTKRLIEIWVTYLEAVYPGAGR